MKKIKILIADDHDVVREGLRTILLDAAEFLIVGEASDGEQAIEKSGQLKPDVVIMDISMPGLNGIDATLALKQKYPSTKVLILTIHENEEYIHQMIAAGANGYVIKNAGKDEIQSAVRAIAAGERFFSPRVSRMMIEEFIRRVEHEKALDRSQLTAREKEILRLISRGSTSQQIADELFISVRTVTTHRNNIMQKLDIHDTAGLVHYAINEGIA